MKKLIVAVLLLFVLATAGIYLLIPGVLTVNNIATVQCSMSGANRALAKKEIWKKFWIGSKSLTAQTSFSYADFFLYKNDTFRIINLSQNALSIAIANNKVNVNSTLQILPLPKDSIVLNWNFAIPASANPLLRIQQYYEAVGIKEDTKVILYAIQQYLSKNENIYGFTIASTSTIDTLLISTKAELATYPTTEQIYSLISKLQDYATKNGALQTGYPMLNITQPDEHHFEIMTAIPINKRLPEKDDITYKRMIPGGFLTTTISGGRLAVENAHDEMDQYFQDYRHTAMAIPFMYLITDRSKEKDTSKWVTKLYFPVM